MDQKQSKSLYDSSSREIFGKHFLAGFAQGLGGFVVTLVSWAAIYLLIVFVLLPQLQGTIEQLNSTLKLIPGSGNQTQETKQGSIQIPEGLLRQLQQSQGQ